MGKFTQLQYGDCKSYCKYDLTVVLLSEGLLNRRYAFHYLQPYLHKFDATITQQAATTTTQQQQHQNINAGIESFHCCYSIMSLSSSSFVGKVVVVTGGGSGIGKALCCAFARAGACVVAVDLRGTRSVREALPSHPQQHMEVECDVTNPQDVATMIRSVKRRHGKIDIYCSNAGIMIPTSHHPMDDSCTKHSLEAWHKVFDVNVFSHVTALRELLGDWERGVGDGHFCVTAAAAGLLTMVGDASYGVSKASALSWCEHVAISHPSVMVHCLCPQAVDTPLVAVSKDQNAAMTDGVLTPEEVADVTLQGIQKNDFFIFPHEKVPKYALRKAQDHARWLKGMQRLRNKLMQSQQQGSNASDGATPALRSKL